LASQIKIPVIGSGEATSPEKAAELMKTSGAAGVMIGRAARGRPWIFRQSLDILAGREPFNPTSADKLTAAIDHARWLAEVMGEKAAFPLRTVLTWYIRDLPGAASFREAINRENQVERQLKYLNQFYGLGDCSREN
jgi:tRNA-dihydrouridine synthase